MKKELLPTLECLRETERYYARSAEEYSQKREKIQNLIDAVETAMRVES